MVRLFSLAGDRSLEIEWSDVLHNLRLALVRTQQRRVKDLSDSDCREAVSNVVDTLRTRSKGLIYEYRSHNPHVQFAADELAAVAAGHETGQNGFRKVQVEDLARCLRYLRRQFEEAQARGVGYLVTAVQVVGEEYLVEDDRAEF